MKWNMKKFILKNVPFGKIRVLMPGQNDFLTRVDYENRVLLTGSREDFIDRTVCEMIDRYARDFELDCEESDDNGKAIYFYRIDRTKPARNHRNRIELEFTFESEDFCITGETKNDFKKGLEIQVLEAEGHHSFQFTLQDLINFFKR